MVTTKTVGKLESVPPVACQLHLFTLGTCKPGHPFHTFGHFCIHDDFLLAKLQKKPCVRKFARSALKESRQGKCRRDRRTLQIHFSLFEAHHSWQGCDAAAAAA